MFHVKQINKGEGKYMCLVKILLILLFWLMIDIFLYYITNSKIFYYLGWIIGIGIVILILQLIKNIKF